MNERKHLLEVYEPYDYEGPNPLRVVGDAILDGPPGNRYYLVHLEQAVATGNNGKIRDILVFPRYSEDRVERATESACTVTIATLRPGAQIDTDQPLAYADVCNWGVGKITPCPSDC